MNATAETTSALDHHDFIIKKKQYVNCVFLLVFTCKQPGACYAHRVMNYKFIAK
jgi:hypothetical protein